MTTLQRPARISASTSLRNARGNPAWCNATPYPKHCTAGWSAPNHSSPAAMAARTLSSGAPSDCSTPWFTHFPNSLPSVSTDFLNGQYTSTLFPCSTNRQHAANTSSLFSAGNALFLRPPAGGRLASTNRGTNGLSSPTSTSNLARLVRQLSTPKRCRVGLHSSWTASPGASRRIHRTNSAISSGPGNSADKHTIRLFLASIRFRSR